MWSLGNWVSLYMNVRLRTFHCLICAHTHGKVVVFQMVEPSCVCVSHKYVRSIRVLAIVVIFGSKRIESGTYSHQGLLVYFLDRNGTILSEFEAIKSISLTRRSRSRHSYSRDRIHHAHWPYNEGTGIKLAAVLPAQCTWRHQLSLFAIYSIAARRCHSSCDTVAARVLLCPMPSVGRAICEIDHTRCFASAKKQKKYKMEICSTRV